MNELRFSNKGNREENQDYVTSSVLYEGAAVYVVADGMGGYSHGDIAAKLVADCIVEYIKDNVMTQEPGKLIRSAIVYANDSLAIKRLSLGCKQMGCVVVILFIIDGIAYLAWIGDSRIYMFRQGKEVFRTKDHSICQELKEVRTLRHMDFEQYASIVTRAVMGEEKAPVHDIMKAEVEPGDIFILCSDGFHKQIDMMEYLYAEGTVVYQKLNAISDSIDDNYSLIRVTI